MMLLAIINFNSIKVRLEQAADLSLARFSRYFNSIKVRLERPKGIMIPISLNKFQFHKGAIRTANAAGIPCPLRSFQFHKGAIRTLSRTFLVMRLMYFNSIKVRLELWIETHYLEHAPISIP